MIGLRKGFRDLAGQNSHGDPARRGVVRPDVPENKLKTWGFDMVGCRKGVKTWPGRMVMATRPVATWYVPRGFRVQKVKEGSGSKKNLQDRGSEILV